jgi:heterodisulfide reductase subunit B
VGEEKVAAAVKTDLSQLKLVPYYGCLLARPLDLVGEGDQEQPMMMDLLLQAAGADVKWWNYKTECCGASVGLPKEEIQRRLSGKVIEQALAAGAEAMVAGCPLCHVNLDLKQAQINKALGTDYHVPILYLSQVLGLAFGLSADDVMLQKNIVDPRPLVKRAIAEGIRVRAEEDKKAAEKAAKEAARAEKAAAESAEGAAPARTEGGAKAGAAKAAAEGGAAADAEAAADEATAPAETASVDGSATDEEAGS